METIVCWSAGGGSLNKEASWRPLYGGAQGGREFSNKKYSGDHCMVEGGVSLNKEAAWRPLHGGAQGGKFK